MCMSHTTTTAATTTDQRIEDARDRIAVLQRQEATTYRRPLPTTFGADKPWRQNVIEWMYKVIDSCGMERDVVAVAAYYLDATTIMISSPEDYQLCAMTALQLAMKLYDSVSIQWSSLIKLGRGVFSEDDMSAMERRILQAMQWRMHPPTALCFLRQYMQLLNIDSNSFYRIEQVSRFVYEFAGCITSLSHYPPSHLAYAGMCVAMQQQRMHPAIVVEIHNTMEAYTSILMDDIQDVWTELNQSLQHNVSLEELLVNIDAHCDLFHSHSKSVTDSLTFKPILPLGSSPRQVSG